MAGAGLNLGLNFKNFVRVMGFLETVRGDYGADGWFPLPPLLEIVKEPFKASLVTEKSKKLLSFPGRNNDWRLGEL